VPKIEQVMPNTRTYEALKDAMFDIRKLPTQKRLPGGGVWDVFNSKGVKRDY
jgi:hypothetical protein